MAKVKADGTGLVYPGYIGGAGDDDGNGIAVDAAGNAYVDRGHRLGRDHLPGQGRARPDLQRRRQRRLRGQGEADGTGLVYCGYIGGAGDDEAAASPWTPPATPTSPGSPTPTEATFPVTVGPDLTFNGGTSDAFVAKVKADGTASSTPATSAARATMTGNGIAVDAAGNAYVTGCTDSTRPASR